MATSPDQHVFFERLLLIFLMKKTIEEVYIIRLILIILLVLYHSFAPYCGSWDSLEVNHQVYSEFYSWIAKLTYSCMLESFTLISGWILGFQYINIGSTVVTFRSIIKGKIKRLIVPSIIFSIIYLLIFNPELYLTPIKYFYASLEGAGHMWYLPMLFWCFIAIILVEKNNVKIYQGIILFSLLSIISFFQLPLRINYTMYYMVFFYGGYLIGKQSIDLLKIASIKNILLFSLCFLVVFVLTQLYAIPILKLFETRYVYHTIGVLLMRIAHLIYSWCGTIALVLLSMYFIHKRKIKLSEFWIKISSLTFGIYIFQQFILKWLYYHTKFIDIVPYPYLIPWIAFGITVSISIILTIIFRSNKFGRLLIG